MDGRQSSDDDEATARTDAQEATATWPPTGAVLVPPGTFFFGAEKSPYPADEEAPVIKAFIKNALWVDKTEATVAQFAKFADATNYQTTAEREGWSFVFEPFLSPATSVRETQAVKDTPWWVLVNGAVVDLCTKTHRHRNMCSPTNHNTRLQVHRGGNQRDPTAAA